MPALKLAAPDQKIIFEYFTYTLRPKNPVSRKSVLKPSPDISAENNDDEAKILSEDLGATIAYADNSEPDNSSVGLASLVWPAVFLGFIGAATSAVYIIRQKKVVSVAGDDFDLLDE